MFIFQINKKYFLLCYSLWRSRHKWSEKRATPDVKDIPDVIAMAPLALECPNAGCDLGASGAKYKTPELKAEFAMRMLDHHVQQNHVHITSHVLSWLLFKKKYEVQNLQAGSVTPQGPKHY